MNIVKKKVVQGRINNDAETFAVDAQNFIDWMKGLGVDVAKSSRYAMYQRAMANPVESNVPKYIRKKGLSSGHYYYSIHHELHIANRIHRAYIGNENIGIVDKLKKIVKGPVISVLERTPTGKKNTEARNYLFELFAGALFLEAGVSVEFGDDRFPEPKIVYDEFAAAVQCKRMTGKHERALTANIEKAEEQLIKNLQSDTELRVGVIAINVDKLINPLGAPLGTASPNEDVLVSHNSPAYHQLQQLLSLIKPLAHKLDDRLDGILVNLSYVCVNTNGGSTTFANHKVYAPRSDFSRFASAFPMF